MLDFIRLLRMRYKSVLNHIEHHQAQTAGYIRCAHSLTLADAGLRKSKLIQEYPNHPIQLVILGPTQAGKSTVGNLLIQQEWAGVSPLAGFTVLPHGICFGVKESDLPWLPAFFPEYQPCAPGNLVSDRLNCYALSGATMPEQPLFPPCVIWDTPDFDSIDAEGYRESVLRAAALADVILLVVSKDKYADQSVWDLMDWLEPLAQPTVICVNKISESSKSMLIESLLEKWQSVRKDAISATSVLPYCKSREPHETLDAEVVPLRNALVRAMGDFRRERYQSYLGDYLRTHWGYWVKPIEAEHNALNEWNELVDASTEEALNIYNRDYLEHPQHNETFDRALAELLGLLEIPGIASALIHTRNFVTWPLRQVMKLGKSITGSNKKQGSPTQEAMILSQIADHLFIHLSDSVLEKFSEVPEQEKWWRAMGGLLRNERADLMGRFKHETEQYQQAFLPEIEQAAQYLYQKLETHPAVLNGLRATRITTDAAAVALAVKTGGIGMHDFVLTPAVLSITSMLTESALGSFMKKVANKLKARQFEMVKRRLFEALLENELYRLPEKMENSSRFNISKETLTEAQKKLNSRPYA